MKTIIKLLLVFVLSASFGLQSEKVYVCNSSKSVAYHETKTCRGLGRCTHEVIYITKKEAVDRGKRACKICY